MKKKMLLITVCLGIGFAIFLPLLAITQNAIIETANAPAKLSPLDIL